MNCNNNVCNRAVFSDNVTFTDGNLVIDVPARVGGYLNCQNYCLFITQAFPVATTLQAPVYITIGGVAGTLYPLTNCAGVQVVAQQIRTRKRYPVKVLTNTTSGSFQIQSCVGCSPLVNLTSLPA